MQLTQEQERQVWLSERRRGLGGSDVAAILGLSKYRTPLDIYNDKLGLAPERPLNSAMMAGVMLEDTVARWYMAETGRKVIKDNQMRTHKSIPFLLANLDRVILPVAEHKGRGVLEVKTAGQWAAANWENEPPVEYVLQIQHYFDVTGYEWGEFAVLIGGQEFRRYFQERDQTIIDMKNELLVKFWNENVIAQVPPQPINSEDLQKYVKAKSGKIIEAVIENEQTIKELRVIKAQIKELEAQKDNLEERIKLLMGDAEILEYMGQTLCTWKANKVSQMFDSKKFAADHPELYAEYLKDKATSRTFLIK